MKNCTLHLSLLALSLTLPTIIMASIKVGSTVPAFSLEDQFEKKWSKSDFSDMVALYMVCDKNAHPHAENWIKGLVPKFKDRIHFVPVADVSGVPGILKGYVRGKIKDKAPFSVLLDWNGHLVKALDMKAGYPTFVVCDKNGVVTHRTWGKGSASEQKSLEEKLEAALSKR